MTLAARVVGRILLLLFVVQVQFSIDNLWHDSRGMQVTAADSFRGTPSGSSSPKTIKRSQNTALSTSDDSTAKTHDLELIHCPTPQALTRSSDKNNSNSGSPRFDIHAVDVISNASSKSSTPSTVESEFSLTSYEDGFVEVNTRSSGPGGSLCTEPDVTPLKYSELESKLLMHKTQKMDKSTIMELCARLEHNEYWLAATCQLLPEYIKAHPEDVNAVKINNILMNQMFNSKLYLTLAQISVDKWREIDDSTVSLYSSNVDSPSGSRSFNEPGAVPWELSAILLQKSADMKHDLFSVEALKAPESLLDRIMALQKDVYQNSILLQTISLPCSTLGRYGRLFHPRLAPLVAKKAPIVLLPVIDEDDLLEEVD